MVEKIEITKRSHRAVRELYYAAITDIECINSVQIKQNDDKIEELVASVMRDTRGQKFWDFYSLTYARLAIFMEALDDAVKNRFLGRDSYALAISYYA